MKIDENRCNWVTRMHHCPTLFFVTIYKSVSYICKFMQMSIENFYAYRSRENNSNKLLANDSNFAAGAVCAGAVCAGACVQVRVIFAATLHQRSNFTAALHLLCGNLATSRQPTGQLRSTGSIEVNGVSPRLCDIIRLYILSGSHPCGRRWRFISQIRFVARNNDSSTSNLGFCTMNARTFFFFFSTTRIATLQRHLSLIFGWRTTNRVYRRWRTHRRSSHYLDDDDDSNVFFFTTKISREPQCCSDNFSHR